MKQYLTGRFWLISILAVMVVVVVMPTLVYGAIPLVQDEPSLAPDSDLDGLLDQIEETGWCNTVGCFQTDPLDADSDDDGLTDGEEKLFETNPLNSSSPGLSVIYKDSFETGEYTFAWTPRTRLGEFRPFGHKMIGTETIVIRRGTTFTVHSPGTINGYGVTLQDGDAINNKSPLPAGGSPLTALTISGRNACGDKCNSWTVTVPANSTVGKYKLVAANGHGWTDQLVVDVIFEIPGSLTAAQIDAFLYDGDRQNDKDTTAVWFYGPDTEVLSPTVRFYASPYNLSQYSSYVFDGEEATRYYGKYPEDYANAIQAIHGTNNTWSASEQLTKRVDQVTCFAYPLTPRTNSWNTLFPSASNLNNQCSNIAGLVTAVHRAVGIPSRLMAVDHRTSNFDTSSEVWTRPNSSSAYTWYTTRGWKADEGTPNYPNPGERYCSTTKVAMGYRERISRSQYGRDYYRPFSKNWPSRGSASNGNEYMIYTSNENLVLGQLSRPGYYWVAWDKYNVSRYDWFETAAMAYWNQDYQVGHEPVDMGNPPTKPPAWNDPIPPDWLPPAYAPTLNSIDNGDGDGNYTVAWSSVAGASSYRLQEAANSSFSGATTFYPGGNLQYAVSGRAEGTWYYRVRAENVFGNSNYSNVVSTTVVSTTITPLTLTGLGVASQNLSSLATTTATTETGTVKVYLDDVLNEYGVDEDGDGQFDYLVLEAGVEILQPGNYWILAELGSDHPNVALSGGVMAADTFQVNLEKGQQVVKLIFDAYSISRTRVDGPYKLMYFLITDVDNPDPSMFVNEALDSKNNSYTTAAYKFNDFDTPEVMFARQYADRAIDSNGDGYAEAADIDVRLDIYQPGTYKVLGELYDSQDKLVGEATWSGSVTQATLRFDNLGGTSGPYQLRNLKLIGSDDKELEIIEQAAYTTQNISQGPPVSGFTATALETGGDLGTLGIETYDDVGIDSDSNGKFDSLEIRVGVQIVDNPGSYQLEGWLVDEQGELVAWAHTGPTELLVGTQPLTLTYDARNLADYMDAHSQTSQQFTLVALKLYTGTLTWNGLTDEVDVAFTTDEYQISSFEPATRGVIALNDLMESGDSQWSGDYDYDPWSIVNNKAYASSSHAWYVVNADATLNTTYLRHISVRKLKFRTYHHLGNSGDTGYVKASSDGVNWTTLTTLSDSIDSWETKVIDLSAFKDKALYLCFELDANSGGGWWYLDDVLVVGLSDVDNDGLTDEEEDLNHNGNPNDDDRDQDGIPDYLEPNNQDTDNDGLANNLDPDDDGDGVLTSNESPDPNHDGNPNDALDSDNDGKPNYLDTDDDGDGVLTSNESPDPNHDGNPNDALDTDNDGKPNYLDTDDDGDGILTSNESPDPNHDGNPSDALDTDTDGKPNYLDSDDDGDGVLTSNESPDPNHDGNPSDALDTDTDGKPNYLDSDDDGDGVLTSNESPDPNHDGNPSDALDTDTDGKPNYLDSDDDGDGVLTSNESPDPNHDGNPSDALDTDTDGKPNYLDSDDDGDGVLTSNESPDPNHDGNPNDALDSDNDGKPNYLDTDDDGDGVLTSNESPDPNHDGNPSDALDTDNDGKLNYLDSDDDGDGILTSNESPDPNHDGNPSDALDTDTDGKPNYLDSDDDGDGILTSNESPDPNHDGNPSDALDTDNDGKPNYLDSDDDGDGVLTSNESPDPNHNGNPSDALDTDNDGKPNYLDSDDDGDGVPTINEDPNGDGDPTTDDTDHDNKPNYLDNDDDGDGTLTANESGDDDNDNVLNYLEPDNHDTDGDGTPDEQDPDDDGDGVPTAEEDWNYSGSPTDDDRNHDGTPDYLDPNANSSLDSDGDGFTDTDPKEDINQDGNPTNDDSDQDGIPDYLEPNNQDTDNDGLANNLDSDDDGDGVLTSNESSDPNHDGNPSDALDTDTDGKPNYLDSDDDGDGILTSNESPDPNHDGNPSDALDTDTDGKPNYLDLDDDGDGILTINESPDPNHDGNPSDALDTDTDGKPNYLDSDDDGDGILTSNESSDPNHDGNPNDALDTDTDGKPNYLDADDDGDSVPTSNESPDPNHDGNPSDALDTDNDGKPNYLDADDDGDGVPTAEEDWNHSGSPIDDDSNRDGTPDYLDPIANSAPTIFPIFLPIIMRN